MVGLDITGPSFVINSTLAEAMGSLSISVAVVKGKVIDAMAAV